MWRFVAAVRLVRRGDGWVRSPMRLTVASYWRRGVMKSIRPTLCQSTQWRIEKLGLGMADV